MNIYNEFMEKLEHKNRINNLLNNDISDKLISNKVRAKSLHSLLSTRPELRENINKIKNKYGYSDNLMEQQKIHQKINELKNKYIKANSNQYKINQVNLFSYTNKDLERNKLDFAKLKNISIPNNNIYEKQRISFCLSSDRIINNENIFKDKNNVNNLNKNINYYKFLKDKRNEYNLIDQKVKKILEDEELDSVKSKNMNSKYSINKRINILNKVKKEINVVNKNMNNSIYNSNNMSLFSDFSYRSYTSLGFNYIKPKINKSSLYIDYNYKNDESKNDSSADGIIHNNKNMFVKPKLIKKTKPNVHVINFSSFYKKN